jgi:hypothetical protein
MYIGMATNRAKAHVYGGKEKKRLVAAKKKDVLIADRVTALKARNFVYSSTETQRLASVIESNIYVEECMNYLTPEPDPENVTVKIDSKYCFVTFAWCVSVFILYTVYSQVLHKFIQL